MKRLLCSLLLFPLLTACGKATLSLDMQIHTDDANLQTELRAASMRVVERRMASLGEPVLDLAIEPSDGGGTLFLDAEDQAALDILADLLTSPFELEIMEESTVEEADQVVEGHGGFKKAGISQEHILWLSAAEEPGGKGRVTITFSPEGRGKMAELFQENEGKFIGIFVRNQLVSKLLVDTNELKDDIVITDIPTVQLAHVFADDVNVGIHVTFLPLPS